MKQHLGARQKVGAHAQLVLHEDDKNLCTVLTNFTKQLSQQMTAIQQQLAMLTARQTRPVTLDSAKRPESRKPAKLTRPASSNPKPVFCYRCGEDGHIQPQCDAHSNPALVRAKRKQFQTKQQEWQKQNSTALN